jgi:MFS family permease
MIGPDGYSGRPRGAIYTLGVLTLVNALSQIDRGVLSLVLPLLKHDMMLSDTVLGLLSGFTFTLFYSLLAVPIAWAADRWNRRNIIAIGLAFWSVMTTVTGLVVNVAQLAIARFLLGAGEATAIAPSTSMIADLFPKEQRVASFAVLSMAAPLGMLIGFPLVGWVAQMHGWRAAFLVMGVPGLVVALVLRVTVRDPPRGLSDSVGGSYGAVGLRETFAFLARSRTYLLTILGGALMSINIHGMMTWTPTFLVRVHHLSMQDVGGWLGGLRGLVGIIGAVASAVLTSRLQRSDERWRVWIAAVACVSLCPADILLLFAPLDSQAWKVGLALDTFFSVAQVGPILALCVSVARAPMRTLAASLYLLVFSLFGQTFGPLVIGILNDRLYLTFGDAAIRYSLLVAAFSALGAGIVFAFAARYSIRDSQRALQSPQTARNLQCAVARE